MPEPTSVIVLAAGQSSRLGVPKGLVGCGGRPWLAWQWDWLRALEYRPVVLVLGEHSVQYQTVLRGLPSAAELVVAVNPEPERGAFSSMQTGFQSLKKAGHPTAAAILPIDVPCPSAATWKKLGAALTAGVEVAVPHHQNKGGHPVVLSAHYVERLSTVPPQSRLDRELRRLSASQFARVDVPDRRILANLNTLEDFAREWETLLEGSV